MIHRHLLKNIPYLPPLVLQEPITIGNTFSQQEIYFLGLNEIYH